jgi:hypothetical protein
MLAQSFKSAEELGISEKQQEALCKVLVLLETDRLRHVPASEIHNVFRPYEYAGLFNMHYSYAESDCGTVACIRGTAELISGVRFEVWELPDALHDLFYEWGPCRTLDPSTAQAATALRNYLTMGHPRWDLAVAE